MEGIIEELLIDIFNTKDSNKIKAYFERLIEDYYIINNKFNPTKRIHLFHTFNIKYMKTVNAIMNLLIENGLKVRN